MAETTPGPGTDDGPGSGGPGSGGLGLSGPGPADGLGHVGGGDRRRVTIRDVAVRAGVSVATVSRVLAGNYPTSAAARAKVLRAVKDLDYVIDGRARALAGTGPKTVAVIVSSVDSLFFADVAQGVEQEAAAQGRLCMVCNHGGDVARELALVQMMREQRAEIVILVGGAVEDEPYKARLTDYARGLAAAGSRLVLCGRPAPTPTCRSSSWSTTTRPARTRWSAICCRPGTAASSTWARCRATAPSSRGSTATGGRSPTTAWARSTSGSPGSASAGATATPRCASCSPSATASRTSPRCSPLTTWRRPARCRDARARAAHPEDISVVGYNNDSVAQDLNPPLTTVNIPSNELGRWAVRFALAEDTATPGAARGTAQTRHVLGTHIVLRESVRRLGAGRRKRGDGPAAVLRAPRRTGLPP